MAVKILEEASSTELEKSVNEFLVENPLMTNLEFHYSTTSCVYMHGDIEKIDIIFSVLIVIKEK